MRGQDVEIQNPPQPALTTMASRVSKSGSTPCVNEEIFTGRRCAKRGDSGRLRSGIAAETVRWSMLGLLAKERDSEETEEFRVRRRNL